MGGRVDPETELMYRHFTELGGPTPWSQVGGGYGTFYIYDMYAAILALEGGGSYEPAVLRHRIPSGNHMHDRGKVDVHRTQRFSRFYLTARTMERTHPLRKHLLHHMKCFFLKVYTSLFIYIYVQKQFKKLWAILLLQNAPHAHSPIAIR